MRWIRSMVGWVLALGVAVSLQMIARVAQASPIFPSELQTKLGMVCPPPCTICHRDLSGGFGTIVEGSFGDVMWIAGLRAKDTSTIAPALEALEAGANDGDGDGVGDVEELRQNLDPNVPDEPINCGPVYGCGARIEPRGRVDGLALAAALVVALGLVALGKCRKRRR